MSSNREFVFQRESKVIMWCMFIWLTATSSTAALKVNISAHTSKPARRCHKYWGAEYWGIDMVQYNFAEWKLVNVAQ